MLRKRSMFFKVLTYTLFWMTAFFSNFALASTPAVMITGAINFNFDFNGQSWQKATLKVLSGYSAPIDMRICLVTIYGAEGKFFISLPVGQKTEIGVMESGVGPICTLTFSARSLNSVDVSHNDGFISGHSCHIYGNPADDNLVIEVDHHEYK